MDRKHFVKIRGFLGVLKQMMMSVGNNRLKYRSHKENSLGNLRPLQKLKISL